MNGTKLSYYDKQNNVMNGIAYRKETDTFFFTGKNWDKITELSLNYKK